MNLVLPDWSGLPAGVRAFCTTRQGGISAAPYDDGAGGGGLNLGMHVGDQPQAVAHNRALLRQLLPGEPAWLEQVHGTTVVDAANLEGSVAADASVAARPGVVCAVMTADCLPVLLSDRAGQVVGAAHAGWRGLAGGVLQQTVRTMREKTGGDLLAWMGPAIGPRQFEVGQEVRDAFADIDARLEAAFAARAEPRKYLADIYALARFLLENAGVASVSGGGFCTVTDAARFYSYRREKITGRMASLIWIR